MSNGSKHSFHRYKEGKPCQAEIRDIGDLGIHYNQSFIDSASDSSSFMTSRGCDEDNKKVSREY